MLFNIVPNPKDSEKQFLATLFLSKTEEPDHLGFRSETQRLRLFPNKPCTVTALLERKPPLSVPKPKSYS